MRNLLLGCAVAGLLAAPAAQAQDAAVFRPVGGWTADFGDDYCRLVRTFSDGKDEVSLALERTQPGAFLRLIMVGEGVNPFRNAETITYNFLPGGSAFEGRYSRARTGDGKDMVGFDPLVLMLNPPAFTPPPPGSPPPTPPVYNRAQELETARSINGVALGEGLTSPVRFETGSLRAPLATMQDCADGLLPVWGLDREKHTTMTAAPVLNPRRDGVLPQGTIQFGDFEKFAGNSNLVRVIIGADGKPTSCTVYQPTLMEALNRRICSLVMSRATFQPAKDADGQPMASFWMGSPMLLGPPFGGARRAGPVAAGPTDTGGPPPDVPRPATNAPDAPFGATAPGAPAPAPGS